MHELGNLLKEIIIQNHNIMSIYLFLLIFNHLYIKYYLYEIYNIL